MKLIDKDVLVAEIIRRRKAIPKDEDDKRLQAVYGNEAFVLTQLLEYIDTLEVKEVDLEKHLKEDIEDVLFDLDGVAVKGATHYLTVEDVKNIAKHFFELGLKAAQKGE